MGGPDTGPKDTERTRSLWFALLLTLANGFLDAHTYIARGGVFANVQTANVIFGAIDTSKREWTLALAHLWPLLAFIAGCRARVTHQVRSGRAHRAANRCVGRWPIQAVALAIIGFVPASVPHSYVTVPISLSGGHADRPVPQHR